MTQLNTYLKQVSGIVTKRSDRFVGLSLWASVFILYIVLAWTKGAWTTRDAALTWWNSVDAAIPELTAKWLTNYGNFLEGWSPFDRGPLQPFILLFTGSIWMGPEISYFVGVFVNCFWAFGLYQLLRALNVDKLKSIAVVFAVSLVGPIWINTVYPWPKMLGAGLSLMAFTFLFRSRILWSILFISLALLAHGSSLFAFVAILPFAYFQFRSSKIFYYFLAVIPAALWNILGSLSPQFGDMRLTQWHFAGTDITDPDKRNPVWSITYQYLHSGWNLFLYKFNNVLATFGILDAQNSSGTPAWWKGSPADVWRAKQMMSVFLAPGVLLLGLFNALRVNRTLWLITLSLWLCYVLLEWGGDLSATAWLHTAPLALVLTFSACLVLPFRWWIVIPVQVIYFTVIWYQAVPVAK